MFWIQIKYFLLCLNLSSIMLSWASVSFLRYLHKIHYVSNKINILLLLECKPSKMYEKVFIERYIPQHFSGNFSMLCPTYKKLQLNISATVNKKTQKRTTLSHFLKKKYKHESYFKIVNDNLLYETWKRYDCFYLKVYLSSLNLSKCMISKKHGEI